MTESKQRTVFRNVLDLAKRVEVIKEFESHPRPKILELAMKFDVCCSQIRNIIFNQEAILKVYKEASENSKEESKKNNSYMRDESKSKLSENPESSDGNNLSVLSVNDSKQVIYDYHSVYIDEEAMLRNQNQRQYQMQFLCMVMYEYLQRVVYHNEPINDVKFQKKASQVKECIAINKFNPSYLWLNAFKIKYGIDKFNLESLKSKIIITHDKEKSLEAVDMVRYVRQHRSALLKCESELMNRLSKPTQSNTLGFSDNNVERDDNEMSEASARTESPAGSSYIATKVSATESEIVPMKVSEYTMPNPIEEKVLAVLSNNKTRKDQSVLKTLKQHFKKPDLNCITIVGRKPKVTTLINDKDLSANISEEELSEEDEFLTILEIVDDEAPTSPASDSHRSSTPGLSNVENDSQKIDISRNTIDGITIKAEPQSDDDQAEPQSDDDQPMENSGNPISIHSLTDDLFVKTETQLDEDIKPTIVSDRSEEFIVNNNDTNYHQHSPSLASDNHLTRNLPLPDIDTLEEAMQHLKVLEHYVMLKENFRAIGLITQLEETIKKPPKL